jgi:hypothetical protein
MKFIKNLLERAFKPKQDQKPDCFSYLRYPQMYAENECYCCEWLEQCDKASGERWKNG